MKSHCIYEVLEDACHAHRTSCCIRRVGRRKRLARGGGTEGPPGAEPGLAPPSPSLTDGCHEVHGDLVRGQGPLPDDELIESSVLVALGLVLLRSYHEVDAGLPVGVRHFPIGV